MDKHVERDGVVNFSRGRDSSREACYKGDEDGEEYEYEVGDEFSKARRVVECTPHEAYAESA